MTTYIEATRRAMYECLDRIRRAAKHRKLTLEFEDRLEIHLEALRVALLKAQSDAYAMIQERDELQSRLAAVDTAYAKSQEALGVAGDEIRYLREDRENWKQDAKFSDDRVDELVKQVRDLEAVVKNQRQGYAELFMETRDRRPVEFAFGLDHLKQGEVPKLLRPRPFNGSPR